MATRQPERQTMKQIVKVSISIPDDRLFLIDRIARAKDRSRSFVISEALGEYILKESASNALFHQLYQEATNESPTPGNKISEPVLPWAIFAE